VCDGAAAVVVFRVSSKQSSRIAANALLRRAVAACLVDGQTAVLSRSPAGAPIVKSPAGDTELYVSLSHTDGLVAVAACRDAPVGVDVERSPLLIDDTHRRLALADRERARFESSARQPFVFWQAWMRKEAVGKALGTGLPWPPSRLDADAAGCIALDGSPLPHAHLVDLRCCDGGSGAVCVLANGLPPALACFGAEAA
jgi:phosphopantetheinyl transferase